MSTCLEVLEPQHQPYISPQPRSSASGNAQMPLREAEGTLTQILLLLPLRERQGLGRRHHKWKDKESLQEESECKGWQRKLC